MVSPRSKAAWEGATLRVAPRLVAAVLPHREEWPRFSARDHACRVLGVAVAWQIVFLIVAKDPVRYRLLMLPAIVEKAGFGIVACILYLMGRLSVSLFAAGIIDLVWGLLFGVAFHLTPSQYSPGVPR